MLCGLILLTVPATCFAHLTDAIKYKFHVLLCFRMPIFFFLCTKLASSRSNDKVGKVKYLVQVGAVGFIKDS